jgi:hypothetical protein
MTEHDILLAVQKQVAGLLAVQKQVAGLVAAVVAERDALRDRGDIYEEALDNIINAWIDGKDRTAMYSIASVARAEVSGEQL